MSHNDGQLFTIGLDREYISYVVLPELGSVPGLDSLEPVSCWRMCEGPWAAEGERAEDGQLEIYLEEEEDLELENAYAENGYPQCSSLRGVGKVKTVRGG